VESWYTGLVRFCDLPGLDKGIVETLGASVSGKWNQFESHLV
jgi:hypothetical protein